MYLTYEEYTDMGGTLSEFDFDFYGYEAESYIDWYTFNRLQKEEWQTEDIMKKVKDMEFYLIRLIQTRCNALGVGGVDTSTSQGGYGDAILAGQSNDGVSVQYNHLAAHDAIKSLNDEIRDVIQRRLIGVVNELGRKILYRGLYPNE